MRFLFLSGLSLTSFSAVMLLSFIGGAYPHTLWGVNLLLVLLFLLIIAGGINDALKLYLEGYSVINRDFFIIAFAPSAMVGVMFLVAISCGWYASLQ